MHHVAHFTTPSTARLFALRCVEAGYAVCIDGTSVRW